MRNLKKILALVLALVMSLSLMATAGAADAAATSSETVTPAYETALQVLGKDGLKVFGGYTDGTIRPQNNITRAEVAAILYRIVTGDVTDAQAGIYTDMANVNFNDLTGANWAKGYINYCANAQLIVGVGGNQFKPLANITGYATLAMILRALGYDKNGEFKGSGWEIRTASKARELGILKNVSENQLGSSATRELVAELLFRAMLCSKVTYNALTQDYDETGVTLGYEVFKLEEVEGVVVANEYADVRRDADGRGYDSVLAADTTVLRDGDGKDRIIRIGSELDDLGMTRRAYTVEDKTVRDTYDLQVLALEDIDKDTVVYDDGEKLTSLSFSGARTDKDTQYFINYGENAEDRETTIKVTYQAKTIATTISARTEDDALTTFCDDYNLDKAKLAADKYDATTNPAGRLKIWPTYTGSGNYRIIYTPKVGDLAEDIEYRVGVDHIYSIVTVDDKDYYRVEIKPGTTLTSVDEYMIKAIFDTANLNPEKTDVLVIDGEVFRGTQSRYDYSDWQSYESFLADCLETNTEAKNTTLSGNSIGWRLRVIDNDKDGYIDWVFQTRYTVTTVNKVAEDGTITLDTDETVLKPWTDSDKVNSLASKTAAMPGETVAAGDVVLYATIDGVNRVWKAEEVANVRVESINRTAATITTADNTTYTESTVHEHTSKKELIDSGVGNMAGKTAYTLYLDKYGNLAAFSQNLTGKLTLLTDGWSNVQKNGIEYAVKAWDTETQKFVQYDVTSGGNLFVATDSTNNNWNRIARFNPLNCDGVEFDAAGNVVSEEDDIHTIMAYVETDGETATLTPVDMIYDTQRLNAQRDVRMIDMGTKIPDSSVSNTGIIYNTTSKWLNNWNNVPANNPNGRNGVYLEPETDSAGNVITREVRALSNTVYYYVYRTWYGSSYSMVVNQVTGYSAGANYLTAAQKQYVEDVYVVGTKATHVDATGDPGKVYYTADAVVVELNDDFYAHFKNDHEEIFIYDFEEVINSVNLEKVKAINGKGEAVEFTIDLTRSDRIYTEGSGKGSEPAPGLFYVWRTNETGDIWAISRMSHAQIRESGHYDVGTVGYSKFTGAYDYFNIYNWYSNNPGYHWDTVANGGCGTNVDHATAMTAGALQKERVGTADSAYYTLRYDSGSYGKDSTLNKGEAEAVMTEHANDIANGATNEVLLRYNGNKVVYAVSFAHREGNNENYAQKVYRGVLLDQAPVAASADVTWYGIGDGDKNVTLDVPTFSDENEAANAITVTYQAAKTWAESNAEKRVPAKTPLAVSDATEYYVTDASGKTVKDTDIAIAPIGGQEYTVHVKDANSGWVGYVVRTVEASNDTGLTYNKVTYKNGDTIIFNGAENTVQGVLDNYFTCGEFANAEITGVVNADNKPVDKFSQWGNGYTATVVVTAENGDTATFTIKFVKGNTPEVPADLKAAREAADAALALMSDTEIAAITDAAKKQAVVDAKAELLKAKEGTNVKAITDATDAFKAAVEAAKKEPTPAEITVKASYKYADLDPIEQTLVKDEQYTVSGKVYTLDKDAVELPDFSGMGECTYAVKINGAAVAPNAAGNYEYTLKDTDTAVNVEVTITPKSETPKPDDGWHEGEPPLERRVSRVLSEDDGTKPIWRYVYTSPDKKPSNTLDFGRSGLTFVEAKLSISKSTETEYCWIVVAKVAATVDVKTIVAAVTFTKNTDKPIVSDEVKAAREAAIEELTAAADEAKKIEGIDTAAVDKALNDAKTAVNGATTVDAVTAAKNDGLKAIEALKPEADTYDVTITNSAEADGVTVTTTPATLTGLAKDTVVTITLAGVPETKTAKVVAGTETLTAEADGSYKLTVTADVTVTISLEDKEPEETLEAKIAAARKALEEKADAIRKENDLTIEQASDLDDAEADADNDIRYAETEAEITAAQEAFEKAVAKILGNSPLLTAFNATAQTATVQFHLDDTAAATAKPTSEAVLEVLNKNDKGVKFTGVTVGDITSGAGQAIAVGDGAGWKVTLNRVVSVTIDDKIAGYVPYNSSSNKNFTVAESGAKYLDAATVAADSATYTATGTTLALTTPTTDVVLYSTKTVAWEGSDFDGQVVATAPVDGVDTDVTLTATGWYVRKGATLTVKGLSVPAGQYWNLKITELGATEAQNVDLKDRTALATVKPNDTSAKTTVTVGEKNLKLSFVKGYKVKFGTNVELPELVAVNSTDATLSFAKGAGLTAGNYVAVNTTKDKEVASVAGAAKQVKVETAGNGAQTITWGQATALFTATDNAYAADGVIQLVPASKVTFDSSVDDMKARVNYPGFAKADDLGAIDTRGAAVIWVANDATLTLVETAAKALASGEKIVANYMASQTDTGSSKEFTPVTVTEEGSEVKTHDFKALSTATYQNAGFTIKVASAAAKTVSLAVFGSTAVNLFTTAATTPGISVSGASVAYKFSANGNTSVNIAGVGTLAAKDKVDVTITLTPTTGNYFASEPTVTGDADVIGTPTVALDKETGVVTITFSVTLTAADYSAEVTTAKGAIDAAVTTASDGLDAVGNADKIAAINAEATKAKAAIDEAAQRGPAAITDAKDAGVKLIEIAADKIDAKAKADEMLSDNLSTGSDFMVENDLNTAVASELAALKTAIDNAADSTALADIYDSGSLKSDCTEVEDLDAAIVAYAKGAAKAKADGYRAAAIAAAITAGNLTDTDGDGTPDKTVDDTSTNLATCKANIDKAETDTVTKIVSEWSTYKTAVDSAISSAS